MPTAADEISWDELKAMIRGLAEQGKETDRRMQETERRKQETDRRLRRLEHQPGRLGNGLGQFVQDMVEPAGVHLFQERGIPVRRVYPNARARDESGRTVMETDLLVVVGDYPIAVEGKSRLTTEDVVEHIERLENFKACFPEYGDKIFLGAVAARRSHLLPRQGKRRSSETIPPVPSPAGLAAPRHLSR